MANVPERSQFESRLPEDPAYWNNLAAGITDSAGPILHELRIADAWWQPLARWSPAIGVAAAAAALLVVVVGPPAPPQPSDISVEELFSLDDPVARAVVSGDEIPNISAMLLVESGGQP